MGEFQPFTMERMMSRCEQEVDYNLSESGVHPLRLEELLAMEPASASALQRLELDYAHANGIPRLRENIAAMYPDATPDDVLVTVGAIEANYIVTRTLLSPGDGIAVMLPNYMQIWGLAKNHGYRLSTFSLRRERSWALDLEQLSEAVGPETRLIAICNPNNPTGHVLRPEEMEAVVAAARRADAWILADEVYAGAERTTDEVTPSFWGRYDKVVAVGSMSKAYGLPGLRLGWAVAPAATVDAVWARHEYVALSASMLSNHLAALALDPAVRPRILERTRGFIRRGFPVLESWLGSHGGIFDLTPPDAAAIACVHYDLPVDSVSLAERLVTEQSLLIIPGDHFGLDRHLRISFGLPEEILRPGLDRLHALVVELAA